MSHSPQTKLRNVVTILISLTLLGVISLRGMLGRFGNTLLSEQMPTSSVALQEKTTSSFPYAFSAKDLYGNTVNELSLAEKELYFVHYWATWCGPCLSEMSDLAKLATDYDERVGFIALVDDYKNNAKGALRIVEGAKMPHSFIMVDATLPELRELLKLVSSGYVPTTVILGSKGELLEQPLIGAFGERYAAILDSLLK